MDDSIKQALLSRFQAYLDSAAAEAPEPRTETADLYSLFVEVAGLRSEVRTESRLVKEALDQFRGVFDLLQRKDLVDRVTDDGEIEAAKDTPPQTTRAKLRGAPAD